MLDDQIKIVEVHPVSTTITLFILSGIAFLIKYWFFEDKPAGENCHTIKAGQDIVTGGDFIVGNKTTVTHIQNAADKNLSQFEKLVETEKWRKELIDHKELWVCEKDNTYQIEIGKSTYDFKEPWTQIYPDKNSSRCSVYLKIGSVQIKELSFIYLDGARIFVPMPELESESENTVYVWYRDNLGYKIANIFNEFYIYKSMERIAQISGIKVI